MVDGNIDPVSICYWFVVTTQEPLGMLRIKVDHLYELVVFCIGAFSELLIEPALPSGSPSLVWLLIPLLVHGG